jgi:hypothetical protein
MRRINRHDTPSGFTKLHKNLYLVTNDVLAAVMNQGVMVNSFKELVPRMNDIFIKLVTEEE